MSTVDGSYQAGPQSGRLVVKTARTGLGAKAGHDLTIEVTDWRADVVADAANPASSSVSAELDAGSLRVREATGGVKPLTDSDRADIENTLRKVLGVSKHPAITFGPGQVSGTAESFRIDGDLTIAGVTKPVTVEGRLDGSRARGTAVVVQSRWGIRPYTAFFGALKLRDEVEVQFDVELTPPGS